MKMYEAAQAVLKDAGKPMHVKDICDEIVRRDLFTFGAKDPRAVLSQTLRKKSQPAADGTGALFAITGTGTYKLAG